jgi:hypothetical protein
MLGGIAVRGAVIIITATEFTVVIAAAKRQLTSGVRRGCDGGLERGVAPFCSCTSTPTGSGPRSSSAHSSRVQVGGLNGVN